MNADPGKLARVRTLMSELAVAVNELESECSRAWSRVRELETRMLEPSPAAESGGLQLKAWRTAKRLSLGQAAEELDVSAETVRKAEMGARVSEATANKVLETTSIHLPTLKMKLPKRSAPVGKAGAALRAWRDERGLNLRQASELIGCSETPIRAIESGRQVTPGLASRIAAVTGVQVPAFDNRARARL